MRQILFLVLITFSIITSCDSDKSLLSDNDILEIKVRLENLAVENLKDWEPPFHVDNFLQDFTQSIDFRFTVDGFHVCHSEFYEKLEKRKIIGYQQDLTFGQESRLKVFRSEYGDDYLFLELSNFGHEEPISQPKVLSAL